MAESQRTNSLEGRLSISDCSRRPVGGADASHSEAATSLHVLVRLSLIHGVGLDAAVFESRFVVGSSVVCAFALLEVLLDL